MDISFSTHGLSFDASVTYHKAYAGCMYRSNGDPGDPPEPEEIEFETLTVNGDDALFLLDSDLAPDIESAACEAADKELEPEPPEPERDDDPYYEFDPR